MNGNDTQAGRPWNDARAELRAAADAAFSDERLRAQRQAILDRLDREHASTRVLAFPMHGGWKRAWMARRDRPAIRWLAAAAAAGLVVGLAAGQLVFTGAPSRLRSSVAPARWLSTPASDAPHFERLSPAEEDAFLSDMELALTKRRNAALRALDDMTPRATHRPQK